MQDLLMFRIPNPRKVLLLINSGLTFSKFAKFKSILCEAVLLIWYTPGFFLVLCLHAFSVCDETF